MFLHLPGQIGDRRDISQEVSTQLGCLLGYLSLLPGASVSPCESVRDPSTRRVRKSVAASPPPGQTGAEEALCVFFFGGGEGPKLKPATAKKGAPPASPAFWFGEFGGWSPKRPFLVG